MYDVAILGAGAVGCAIARELSKYKLKVIVIEKDSDVSNGTSKANSGIIHGGYDAKYGTLKGKLSIKGNLMFKKLDEQLHFGFNKCGSFVLAFDAEDKHEIQKLYENGKKNGVVNLQIVDKEFILKKNPHVNPEVECALYCSDAGIISPWEYTIALAENAYLNGVKFLLHSEVIGLEKIEDHFNIQTTTNSIISKYVVNATGLYSDEISKMIGVDGFKIIPRKGEYILFDKNIGNIANSVLFQTPRAGSKGTLVTPTYHGNLMIGPNAQFVNEKTDLTTTRKGLSEISLIAKKTIKKIDHSKIITQFSGLRATTENYDFIIEETKVNKFINVAGIDSPGLTSSPAIAIEVLNILKNSGLDTIKKSDFHPNLNSINRMDKLSVEEKNKLIRKDKRYGQIICRCEGITHGEIVEALHRPIPCTTLDSVKRRVRAGAGRCQGGFCSPKILEIMSKELDKSLLSINKSEHGSNILISKTKISKEEIQNER
ncbi:MAG: NAD(P)/FAD-dependent oxidoreductase [Eubacteriaceae bacterium]